MHILYLVPHVPNPTKIRSYMQVYGLHRAGNRVTVATLQRSAADEKHIQTLRDAGIEVLSVNISKWRLLLNVMMVMPTKQPIQARIMWSPELLAKIESYCDEQQPDVIHVEHLRMAAYGLKLKERFPLVWDAVDYLTLLFEQTARQSSSFMWRVIAGIESPRLPAYERWLTAQFLMTLVISNRDQRGLERDNPYAQRIRVVLLAVEVLPYTPKSRETNTLIFTGTMNYHPNVSSALFFVHEILPRIQAVRPDIKLWLVGAHPVPAIQALQSPSIEVTGFVPSVVDYLQRATIAVAPVTYAAGMQTKVLEAFLTGTPLVATSKAVENLPVRDGEHLRIADTPQDFADAVLKLLQAPEQLTRLGEAGNQYVTRHHDIEHITQELIQHYQDTITLHTTNQD